MMKLILLALSLVIVSSCNDSGGGSSDNPVCNSGVVGESCSLNPESDTTEFKITGSLPEAYEKNVPVEGPFAFFLGDDVEEFSIVHNSMLPGQDNTLKLINSLTEEEVLVDVQVNGNEILITPSVPLEGSTEYTFELTDDVQSSNGEKLTGGHKIFVETETTNGSSVAGETVLSWTAQHEKNKPVTHFVLYYGADSANKMNSSGEEQIDPSFDWDQERIIRPKELNPELEGQRAYHAEFNNNDLPGVIPGTYNYFSMRACNEYGCSPYSKQVDKYFD